MDNQHSCGCIRVIPVLQYRIILHAWTARICFNGNYDIRTVFNHNICHRLSHGLVPIKKCGRNAKLFGIGQNPAGHKTKFNFTTNAKGNRGACHDFSLVYYAMLFSGNCWPFLRARGAISFKKTHVIRPQQTVFLWIRQLMSIRKYSHYIYTAWMQ